MIGAYYSLIRKDCGVQNHLNAGFGALGTGKLNRIVNIHKFVL